MKLQGVVTTGIYCRADCRARPRAEHVRSLPNGVAAMAGGYRPCLLCRPDRLPDLGGAPRTPAVAHALRLIASGFLDDASTEDLAARVGYSARQLLRLFEVEVGASPDFVARAHRAHLARRLLDETSLTITAVAFAAGFASIRQMNRVMRELFGFSPSELRRKRRRGDLLDPLDGGLRLRVPHGGVVDPTRMLTYLAGRAIPGVEEVVDGVYRRTIVTCGHPGVAEVRDAGDGEHLEVTLHLAT
ncbi:MAG: DNA-3-methyladenine glycosylase 2 family protein, partial [Planctomycetes bacterium]|nr:DNA-3-methyladenine glycosylase 2 family protein [Planctomycetota bacterium]